MRLKRLLPATLLLTGCFSYRPAELGTVPVGQQVRVQLTRTGAAELPEVAVQGTTLRGRVVGREADRLRVRVAVGYEQEALVTRELGRDVDIPAGEIVSVQRREFDKLRTGALVAGGVGVIAVILNSFGVIDNEDPVEFPTPPEEGARIPIFTIRFH